MLTAARALAQNVEAGKELPKVAGLTDLYALGVRPRHGEVIMIAGRSGTLKSGLALFWVAQMNLPTLYFSADMSGFTASSRLASMLSGRRTEEVEADMTDPVLREQHSAALNKLNISFSFGSPITWRAIDEELEAYVELHDEWPAVIVFDNLMDFDGAEAEYAEQMQVMSGVTEIARYTGATVMILHHATDKSWDAKSDPWAPPSRDQIKGGLSEKPELSLSVAFDPGSHEFRIAPIKQRSGFSDPTARAFATLRAYPEFVRFGRRHLDESRPAGLETL